MATEISRVSSAEPSSVATPTPRNLTLALVVIAVAQLMVVLDVAIVNVALPSIQRSLDFTATDLEWVANAYAIAFGGLLLLGGRAGDRFGRLRMFVIGTLLFTVGSGAGGFATTSTFLIIARAAQGVGAAIVAPTALALLADTFAEGTLRNRALGVYSAVAAGGGALGLLLGGVITNYLSWRWILFVNVPIGLLLTLAAPRALVASKGTPGRLDLPGAVAVTGGAILLVYGLSRTATHGWSDTLTVGTLGAALLLLIAFLVIEAISRQPLMPLRILRSRTRSGAYALSLANGATLSGLLFLLTLFLQGVLGFSPLQAGFAFLPTAAGVVVSAGITSRLIGRVGPRLPMTIGALLAAIGLFWLSQISEPADYVSSLLGPLLAFSAGAGTIFVSTSVVAISGVQRDESGLASALLNAGRQLGGSLGIAIMGTIATTVTADRLANATYTPAAVNQALTAGYGAAFVGAGVIAVVGFVIAIAAVRDSRDYRQEADVVVAAGRERERMALRTATAVFRWLVRLTGALQIALGAFLWIGAAGVLMQVHIVSGVVFVLSLATLAIVAATAGVQPRFVALAIVWAVVVLSLGLTQAQILPGPYHWIIQVAHVVIGLGAIGQSEGLVRRIKRGRQPAVAA